MTLRRDLARTFGISIGVLCTVLSLACRNENPLPRDSLFARANRSPQRTVSNLQALYETYGLPIRYWPDSALADSLNRAGVEEGACGQEVVRWVKRLTPTTPRYALDRVIEFNDTAVIREWPFPANEVPSGVGGDELLADILTFNDTARTHTSAVPVLGIRPDGSLRVVPIRGALPSSGTIACPSFATEERSSYWVCGEFLDLATHATRRLGYEGTCS
jgi:hypothetical protein